MAHDNTQPMTVEKLRQFIRDCGMDPVDVRGFTFDVSSHRHTGAREWVVTFERYKTDEQGRRYADPLRHNIAATELVDICVTDSDDTPRGPSLMSDS
jgi:hypothetical protein